MSSTICACCGQPFEPRPQVPGQAYCSSPDCQRARKRQWQQTKLQSDSDYRFNQRAAQQAWSQRNPDYWRDYRDARPEYAKRTRHHRTVPGGQTATAADIDVVPTKPPDGRLARTAPAHGQLRGGRMSKKHRGQVEGDPVTYQTPLPAGGVQMETFLPWTLVRRGLKKQVITPLDAPQEFLDEARREQQVREMSQDTPLMRALGFAHHWQRLLDEGRFSSMTEIAAAEGIDLCQASKMSRLAQLAPDLIEAIALGHLEVGVSQLLRGKLSASWLAQREALVAGSR